jgi:hypothetical protein
MGGLCSNCVKNKIIYADHLQNLGHEEVTNSFIEVKVQ